MDDKPLGRDDLERITFKGRPLTKPLHSVPDCIDDDGTPAAHPAWWRGHSAGVASLCQRIKEILDGSDDGSGVASEPWESVRRELIELKKWDGRAEHEEGDVK